MRRAFGCSERRNRRRGTAVSKTTRGPLVLAPGASRRVGRGISSWEPSLSNDDVFGAGLPRDGYLGFPVSTNDLLSSSPPGRLQYFSGGPGGTSPVFPEFVFCFKSIAWCFVMFGSAEASSHHVAYILHPGTHVFPFWGRGAIISSNDIVFCLLSFC